MIKIVNNFKRKFYKLSDAQKSAIAYMFASFVQQGISFVITPLFTRLMSTSEFGTITVYNSWVEMVATLATLSLYSGIFNVGMVDFENSRDSFTSALLGLSNVATIIIMTLFYLGSLLFPNWIGLSPSLVFLMLLYFLFYPATRFWIARQRFEYKYKMLTVVTILSALLSPMVGLLAVLLSNSNLGVARLWGSNSVIISIGIIFYIYIIKRDKRIFDKKLWKYALAFSLPLVPHYLAMHVLAASDKVMIQNYIGTPEAALYGLAYTASMVITVAWTAINGSLTPYIMEKLKRDKLDEIQKVALPCVLIFSSLCILVVILAPEVILILGGEKYMDSIPLIPPLIASVLFMEMYNLFAIVEFYHKKTVFIMIATSVAALLNIILNALLMPRYGFQAAAYTTLVCYVIYCFLHFVNMKRIETKKIYDGKLLIVISIVYVLICLGILPLYPNTWLRYTVLAVISILALILRRKIWGLYSKMKG